MNVMSFSAHILLVPLMVASSISIPFSLNCVANASDIMGSAVVVSIRVNPFPPVSNNLRDSFTTSSTTWELGRDKMMTSTCSANWSGESIPLPPASTIASILLWSMSNPMTRNSSESKFLAISFPIKPRPTKPILCFPMELLLHSCCLNLLSAKLLSPQDHSTTNLTWKLLYDKNTGVFSLRLCYGTGESILSLHRRVKICLFISGTRLRKTS